jgi:hypothetical protein
MVLKLMEGESESILHLGEALAVVDQDERVGMRIVRMGLIRVDFHPLGVLMMFAQTTLNAAFKMILDLVLGLMSIILGITAGDLSPSSLNLASQIIKAQDGASSHRQMYRAQDGASSH